MINFQRKPGKILIIGPKFYNYNNSIADAFNKLGIKSHTVEYTEPYTPYTLANRIKNKLRGNQFQLSNKIKFNQYIKDLYDEISPDIVLVIKGNNFLEETVLHFKNSKNFIWMMDSIINFDNSKKIAKHFDNVFCFEYTDIDYLEKINIKSSFLPLAADDNIYRPLSLQKSIDILFIGNLNDERICILNTILETFPNLRIEVYGKYYHFLKNPMLYLMRKNKKSFRNKNILPEEACILYNKSKICLNLHHKQSKHGVNPRFFEILSTQSYQLVNAQPYITENFKSIGFETFSSLAELLSTIEQILNQERYNFTSIINYEIVKREHTFINRANEILKYY